MTTPVFLYLSDVPPDFKKVYDFLRQEKVLCIDGALGDGWSGAKESKEIEKVLQGQVPLSALIKSLKFKKWDVLEGMNHSVKFKMLDEFKKKDLWDDLSILKKHYQSLVIYTSFDESDFSFYLSQDITALWLDMPDFMEDAVMLLQGLKSVQNFYQGEVYFLCAEGKSEQSVRDFLQKETACFDKLTCHFAERYA